MKRSQLLSATLFAITFYGIDGSNGWGQQQPVVSQEAVPKLDLDKFIPFGVDPRSLDPLNPQPKFQLPSLPPGQSYPDVGLSTEPAWMPDIAKQPIPMNNRPVGPYPQPNHGAMGETGFENARWRFNFYQAPWESVIRNFAQENGLSLIVASMPQGEFSYFDQKTYGLSEAIDVLNDHLIPLGHLLVRNQGRLTLLARQNGMAEGVVPFVSIRDIQSLGRNEMATVPFAITTQAQQTILPEIQQLLSSMGSARLLSNSNRLVITDTGSFLRRIRDLLGGYGLAVGDTETIVIPLRNTKAEAVAMTLNQRSADMATVRTASTAQGSESGAASGPISFLKETNTLVLSGNAEELARIQSLVAEIDRAPSQVVIQGLLLEVNLGNTKELGAEIGLQDSVLFDRSVLDNLVTLSQTATAPNGVQTTNQNILSQTAAPGFAFNTPSLGNNVAISPNTIGSQGLSNLGVGRTSSDLGFAGLALSASSNSVSLLLRALAAKYKTEILSRPQIRSIDNTEALIQIGQQVPVIDGVTVTAVGSANPVIRQDRAGIILKVTPHISPDGLVQIKVEAEKSAFRLTPGSGVPVFADAKTGTVIQAPIKDLTTAQATVSARAGQTIVLGGMITTDDMTVERKVPFLGDIPLLGRLFRYDKSTSTRKELLIFLTPQIINCDGDSEQLKALELQKVQVNFNKVMQMHGPILEQTQMAPGTSLQGIPNGQYLVPETIESGPAQR